MPKAELAISDHPDAVHQSGHGRQTNICHLCFNKSQSRGAFHMRPEEVVVYSLNIVFALGFLSLLLIGGSGAEAQMTYTLNINFKDVLAGIFVQVQNPDSSAEATVLVSGQSDFNIGDTTFTVTAGELMAVSKGGMRFLPSEKTDIGEVAVALGPETVFCLADGTISNDWFAVGQSAVVMVPQDGGPAISVRNTLWMVDLVEGSSSLLDPSCSNADYPVLAVN
jgi:hypothetical protein